MAQSSKPRSDSSASNRRQYHPKRIPVKQSGRVHTSTPRVFDQPAEEAPPRRSSSRRSTSRRGTNTSRTSARSGRRPTSSKSRSKQKNKMGLGFKLGIVLTVVLALGGGYAALYFSNFLAITKIEVSGNEKLQMGYVLSLAQVPEDSTFLRIDTAGISERIKAEPWIQSVNVERSFPSTIILRVTERPVAAVVDIVPETANDSVQKWAISADGTWISPIDATANEGVQIRDEEYVDIPKIKDVSAAVRPVTGVLETDEGVINALALLKGFSPEMRSIVSVISAPDAVKTTLTLSNNVGVAFGAAEDIEAKERAIATLLAEHEGTITSINVRVADRPSYRATE